ncbi:hypothetical protein ACFSTE_20435 [Aquimarina hainanensis]|uniref:Lipoprotein n=1 Tax=Aquimarina hainanensis TaxID=1578017 RepID=A0ABW5NE89_9FLAO
METSNNMNRLVFLLILLFTIISCKNNAQENISLNNEQKILKGLPDDIANKTWIYIHSNPEYDKYNTYKNILDYNAGNSIKTEKNLFHTVLDVYETYYFEIPFDSVTLINNIYQINFKHSEIDYAKFKWLNKNKGIGEWEIRYLRYFDGLDSIVKNKSVIKSFVTKDNFPEPKKEDRVLEKEKSEDNKFAKIEKLPIIGEFACVNEPSSFLSFKYEEVKLRDSEGEVIEIQPYKVILSLTNQIYLSCTLRKVKDAKNKYALFYRHAENTEYFPEDILSFSKTHPIAEIEILENNTIKNKWIGMYNRRTKKVEGYGVYNWIDKCDNTLSKVED